MKRLGSFFVALVLTSLGILGPVAPARADDRTTITKYDSDYTIDAAGDVVVVETLTVDFPEPRHGIFRTFGRQSIEPTPPLPNRDSVRVTRDGRPEPTTTTSTQGGFVVRVGDASRTITGIHVYRIHFTVTDAVNPGDDEGAKFSEFFWETVDEHWDLRILSSRVTVHLPAVARFAGSCGVGSGETEECGGGGTDTTTYTTGALDPGTDVTVRVDYGDAGEGSGSDPARAQVLAFVTALLEFFDALFS
jgi:hypothetical protein